MLQEAGDEEGLQEASKKLREYKDKYRDYFREHRLGMHNDRTQVYGYDRSKSMKTVWVEGKAFVKDMTKKAWKILQALQISEKCSIIILKSTSF